MKTTYTWVVPPLIKLLHISYTSFNYRIKRANCLSNKAMSVQYLRL